MKFLRNKLINLPTLALLLCAVSSQAFAAGDEVYITVGAKVWNNKWTSWDYYPPIATLPGASENFTSSSQSTLIPSLALRYKDFLVTGSVFSRQEYEFVGSNGTPFKAKRDETDLHFGYYVLPTLALTLGYKTVKQDFGASTFKYNGPIIGAAASAPLTQNYSLYGNFGYGAMKAEFPAGFTDNSGRNKLDADYYLGEVGVAYSFDVKSFISAAKAMTATLGYRNQTLATQGFAVGTDATKPALSRSTELRDNTEGLVLGMSLTF